RRGPGRERKGSSNGGALFARDESRVTAPAGSTLTVSYSSFTGNQARGGDGGAGGPGVPGGSGGQGAGGAIGIIGAMTGVDVNHRLFTGNQALGGNGGRRGRGAPGASPRAVG